MMNYSNDWHYPRLDLAKSYLDLFKMGLTSGRGLFARRRMGKTEFLKKDLIPLAESQGYVAVYVNLWDLETDPATAIISELYKTIKPKGFSKIWDQLKKPVKKLKGVKASGGLSGLVDGSLEAEFHQEERVLGTLLMEAMAAFDQTKGLLMLVIDEAQVLAYGCNSAFAHALRSALDIRKERIKVIFAGSSETTLRKMFGVASEPFYNWAPLEPFELLGEDFVRSMVGKVNDISKYPLDLQEAQHAFLELKNTPEFFRRYIERYVTHPGEGAVAALDQTKQSLFNDGNFKRQWDDLLAVDQIILSMMSEGILDLHSKTTLERISTELGLEEAVNRNTAQNALRRLVSKHVITKIDYAAYQFEDEAFADWVKHRE